MIECLVEEGIAEHRAILLEDGHIINARIDWPGSLAEGQIEDAVLIARAAGSTRGTARFASGEQALVDRLPREACEGAAMRLEVTRAAIPEEGRVKLAQARPTDAALRPRLTLVQSLRALGYASRVLRRFPACDWDELWAEAADGTAAFTGGSLHFAPTPAMTVVDVDGELKPRDLALAAVPAFVSAAQRFDLAGSIGIDFPTLEAKADRKAVDALLGDLLAEWPHERTAMNGFGFVQIAARLRHPSLLHLLRYRKAEASARRLLRQGEMVEEAGTVLLSCNPAVEAALRPEWLDELARRCGRPVRVAVDPALATTATFAQAVPA